jgi:hypothetical protein
LNILVTILPDRSTHKNHNERGYKIPTPLQPVFTEQYDPGTFQIKVLFKNSLGMVLVFSGTGLNSGPFCFRYFSQQGLTFMQRLTCSPPVYTSHVAVMTGTCHHILLFIG